MIFIALYKDGKSYLGEVTKYYDGMYELLLSNIKPWIYVGSLMKKYIKSASNMSQLSTYLNFDEAKNKILKMLNNGTTKSVC